VRAERDLFLLPPIHHFACVVAAVHDVDRTASVLGAVERAEARNE